MHSVFLFIVAGFIILNMPDLSDIKKSRGVAKGKVTRLSNRISLLIAEDDDLAEIPALAKQLKLAFEEFASLHEQVVDLEPDTDESIKYFQSVQENYIATITKVKVLKNESASRGDTTITGDNDMVKLLCLPKIELQKFSGDPLQYHSFIKSFEVNVERFCSDPDLKLARLLQYTSDDAFDAISGSSIIGGQAGYDFALRTLKELYGSKHRVTESIIKSLRKAKPVRSPHDMRALSHELRNAFHVLENVDSLAEVNAQVIIFDIVTRLPNFAQNKWQKKTLKSKRMSDAYLKFKDLVEFVEEIADEMNDPLCGTQARSDRKKSVVSHDTVEMRREQNTLNKDKPNAGCGRRNHADKQSHKSLTDGAGDSHVNANTQQQRNKVYPPCPKCSQAHSIMRCPEFKALKVPERIAFVRTNKLCANCFRDNHAVDDCNSKNRCFVCQRKHSAFLHSDTGSISHAINSGDCFLPVVTVQINDCLYVNAALDSFSSSSFCSQNLADRLNLTGPTYHYTLKTMSGSSPASSKQVNFEITGDGQSIVMSGVKVVGEIPVSTPPTGVFNQADYSHLRGLKLTSNLESAGIDILIGQDNADFILIIL